MDKRHIKLLIAFNLIIIVVFLSFVFLIKSDVFSNDYSDYDCIDICSQNKTDFVPKGNEVYCACIYDEGKMISTNDVD